MKINYIGDYKEQIAKLDSKITNNPAFKHNVEYIVEDLLHNGELVDLEILNDTSAKIIVNPKILNIPNRKTITMTAYEINMQKDGGFEVIKSKGEVIDGTDYYSNPMVGKRPSEDIKGILNVIYDRNVFDSDGIQIQSTNYFKCGYPVKENCFKNEELLKKYLLTDGELKPVFDNEKIIIPNISECSIIKDVQRNKNNPALAFVDKYERAKSNARNDFSKVSHKLGMIDGYWPEVLKVEDYNLFASREKEEDNFEVLKDTMRGGNISLEEAVKNATNIFSDILEESNTKRNGLIEYLVLRSKCNDVIEELSKGSKSK